MSRLLVGLAAGGVLVAGMGAANAADWGVSKDPVFKPAYPVHWEEESPLGFEVGMRYWYSFGGHTLSTGGNTYNVEDQSHILELHARIDDHSTNTYLKANAGVAAVIDGTYNTPGTLGSDVETTDGRIAYAGADFGYMPLSTNGFKAGGFVGYQYMNDSVYMGRTNYLNSGGGINSEVNNLEIHALRLGLTARAELSDMIDFTVDAAIIPYASLSGVYGAFGQAPFGGLVQGSPGDIEGNLYGGAIDAMVGFHPTENFTVRAGARGHYLTGPVRTNYVMRDPGDPDDAQGYVQQSTDFEMFRWGPVVELTYRF